MANRVLHGFEKKQRGCQYCLHVTTFRHNGEIRNACPFDKCPFEVLDKYRTFEEFMASEDSKILVNEFFTSIAGCYEHINRTCTPKKVFSDGDGRLHI